MIVHVEGVGNVEFEDGTPPEVIRSTVKKLVSSPAQKRVDAMPWQGRALAGLGEAGLQAATGFGSSVVGGLAGLVDAGLSLAGAGSGSPGDTVRKVQQFGTYQPRSEQGQRASEILGAPMELYGQGVRYLGDQVRGGDAGGARDFAGTTVDVAGESLPTLLGGMAALKGAARPTAPRSLKQETLAAAQKEGYTVPPSMADRRSFLEGVGGKIRSAQLHSAKNAEVTTKIAVRELGMPEGTVLTPEVLSKYKKAWYDAGYVPLKQNKAALVPDEPYLSEIVGLTDRSGKILESFPEAKVAGTAQINSLANGMLSPSMTFEAAVERIRQLRFESKQNFKAYDNPAKQALARAQKSASDSLESLMERTLEKSGNAADLDRFRAARTAIAKANTVEDALNAATGNVSARKLASSKAPLTGGMNTAARFAEGFPKAVQMPEAFGGTPPLSPLDASMGTLSALGGAAATGSAAGLLAGGWPLLRPFAAPMTRNPLIQQSLVRNPTPLPPEFGVLPFIDPEQRRVR